MTDPGEAMETIGARALGELPPNPTALDAAYEHMGLGLPLPRSRFMLWKKLVVRACRIFLHRQVAFNEAVARVLSSLDERDHWRSTDIDRLNEQATRAFANTFEVSDLVPRQLSLVDAKLGAAAAVSASIDSALVEQIRQGQSLAARLEALEQRGEVAGGSPSFDARLAALEARVAEQHAQVQTSRPTSPVEHHLTGGDEPLKLSIDLGDFYAAFERAFRGPEALVREWQSAYVDDLKANAAVAEGGVVDIGCGRGELLGLLHDNDIRGIGVDTSEEFVQHNRDAGHEAVQADALEYLRSLPAGSVGAITAMHIIEHLPHEVALQLLDLALVALRPGGLLIIETPNPTNLLVGASTFYLDPTHLRPVHPAYLEFAASERGFVDTEIRLLHPMTERQLEMPTSDLGAPALHHMIEHVNTMLFGAQDYALIARRPH